MESVVEFLAVIHRVLGSITSLGGIWKGKEWEKEKANST